MRAAAAGDAAADVSGPPAVVSTRLGTAMSGVPRRRARSPEARAAPAAKASRVVVLRDARAATDVAVADLALAAVVLAAVLFAAVLSAAVVLAAFDVATVLFDAVLFDAVLFDAVLFDAVLGTAVVTGASVPTAVLVAPAAVATVAFVGFVAGVPRFLGGAISHLSHSGRGPRRWPRNRRRPGPR